MAVYESDIKFFHRAEDNDSDTGCGPITANEIQDGAIGGLFSPTSELDGLEGRVKIRGAAAAIDTVGRELFGGAHILLTEVPDDPALNVTLVTTGNEFARRPEVVSALGSYYVGGGLFPGIVYQVQRRGSLYLQIWQQPGAPTPKIGSTIILNQDHGTGAEVEQYVQVKGINIETITLEDDRGVFSKQFVTLTLGKRLVEDFNGLDISRFTPSSSLLRTKIFNVSISDSAHYYGTGRLAEVATVGRRTIKVISPFTQLIPASESLDPKTNLTTGGQESGIVSASTGTATRNTSASFGPGVTLYVRPWVPGTLSLQAGGTQIVDQNGDLMSAGASVGTAISSEGKITGGAGCPVLNGPKSITYQPAGVVEAPCQTSLIEVTASNQSLAYTTVLPVIPLVGSIQVEYIYQGDTYVLRDRGDYYCVGDSDAFGYAQFTPGNKSLAISLEVFPDISWIVIKYAVKSYTFTRGGASIPGAYFLINPTAQISPGETVITWNDGAARTASVNIDGSISGDATGIAYFNTNQLKVYPNIIPPHGTEFVVAHTPRLKATEAFDPLPLSPGGIATVTLANKNVVPGSIQIAFNRVLNVETDTYYTGQNSHDAYVQSVSAPPSAQPVNGAFIFKDNGAGAIPGLASVSINYTGSTADNASVAFDPHWMQAVKLPYYTLDNAV